ncbi:MAG: hypothetical protein WDA37_07645, partial [Dysgonamonadaceae bacterium]
KGVRFRRLGGVRCKVPDIEIDNELLTIYFTELQMTNFDFRFPSAFKKTYLYSYLDISNPRIYSYLPTLLDYRTENEE